MIVVYLTSVAEKGLGSVLMARAAIRYFNLKYDSATTSPSDDKKVSCLVLALKRKMGKPVTKREPTNHDYLQKLLKFYLPEGIHSDELLIKFCWANFYSIMYFCSARYEEVAHLNLRDIVFTESFNVKLTFSKAKNNQFGNALTNFITKLDHDFCPSVIMRIYIDLLIEGGQNDEDPLFPNLRGDGKTIIKNSQISSDNARNVLKKTLVKVGLPASLAVKFGLHSFRIGAVQTALSSGQLLEVNVQKAGCWK